jgi:catechol 2,3-dioxygenase-like lactoylglutathione lyase family enzyme
VTALFSQLHHVCIVVHDIDASVAYYENLGIGPWQPYPPLTQYTTLNAPDKDAVMKLKYRFVNLENVQVQLCEPPQDDCPQRRFLDTRGEGVFQLGFEAPIDAGTGAGEALGLRVLMSGRRDNGTGFTYFDTLDDAGVMWMIRQTEPQQP